MRKIFITVNDGSIARNILRSFVLEKLLENPGLHVGLITHDSKRESYEEEFGSSRVKIYACPQQPFTLFNRILSFLIRNGLRTETILMDQRTHVDGRWLAFILKRIFTYLFGKSRLFHAAVRKLFLWRPPSSFMRNLFLREKPDLLFSTDVQAELDFDAIAAARRSGTRIIGMVRSWDNLTARGGLVPYIPEKLLVWNPFLFEQAIKIQHIPQRVLEIVGIPQYDWCVKKEIIKSREDFLRQFGIDPRKKVVLFAGEGAFHAPHEVGVLEILSEELKRGSIKNGTDAVVIFRPHPAFKVDKGRARELDNIIFDEGTSDYTGKDPSSWEMGREQIAHLVNLLYHSDLVITTASTITLDAVAFDKPVVCIAFDGKSKEPYWKSVLRYYRDYTHYKDLTATGGFKVAYNAKNLIRYINEYLKNPALDADGRRKIIERFIWKLDGQSAERIAETLLKNIQ